MLPWRACDFKVQRGLYSFGDNDTAGTKAGKSHAGGALHAKEELGWGGGAHRERCSVGERVDGDRLWVSQAAAPIFGLWRVCFPPCLVRPGRRLPVQGLSEGSLGFLVSLTGYPRNGAPGPG